MGWLYLAIGTGISLLLSVILLTGKSHGALFEKTFPVEIPLFAILGATGGLLTFTSDRTKGVFEYLLSYRVSPRRLFVDGLVSTAAMVSIVLTLVLSVGIGAALARGVSLDMDFVKSVGYYTIPMSFAGALLTATVGMIWSSVSTPRSGINSPVGISPMVGVGPAILVLVAAESVPASDFYYVTVGAASAIVAIVVVLLLLSSVLMGRERFLSPL